jgi:hypothetical protein
LEHTTVILCQVDVGAKLDQRTTLDGIFEVTRARSVPSAATTSRLILICRDGRLFGADSKGRVYTGQLIAERASPIPRLSLRGVYEMPLQRRPPWRAESRPHSVSLPIFGMIDPHLRTQKTTVRFGASLIDIEINYLGPLPP